MEKITLMALGSVFPSWSEEEQGIGDKLVMKAVGDAVGVSVDVVEDAIRDEGDIGAAAEKLYAKKAQMTFFSLLNFYLLLLERKQNIFAEPFWKSLGLV